MCVLSRSVKSHSFWFHGLLTIRLLCPWTFSGMNPGVGNHFLLQRLFLIQGSNPHLLHFLHQQADLFYPGATWEANWPTPLTLLPGVQHDLIFLYISTLSTCCLVAFVTIRRHYAIIEWLTLFHNFTHFFFNWKSVPLNLSHLFLSSFHSHPSGNHLFVLCM